MANITNPSLAMTETSCGVDLPPLKRPRDSCGPVSHGSSRSVKNTKTFFLFLFFLRRIIFRVCVTKPVISFVGMNMGAPIIGWRRGHRPVTDADVCKKTWCSEWKLSSTANWRGPETDADSVQQLMLGIPWLLPAFFRLTTLCCLAMHKNGSCALF